MTQRIWVVERFHDNDHGIFASLEAAKASVHDPYGIDLITSYSLVGDRYETTPEDQNWRWCKAEGCQTLFQYIDSGWYTCFDCFERKSRCPRHIRPEKIALGEAEEGKYKQEG